MRCRLIIKKSRLIKLGVYFENGKGVRVPASAYETKSNRRKLTGAYSGRVPIVAVFYEDEPFVLLLISRKTRGY